MDYSMKDADENEYADADLQMKDASAPYSRQQTNRRPLNLGGSRLAVNHVGANNQAGARAYAEDFYDFLLASSNNQSAEDEDMDDAEAPFSPQPTNCRPTRLGDGLDIGANNQAGNRAYREDFNASPPAPDRGARFTPINAGERAYQEDDDAIFSPNPAVTADEWNNVDFRTKGKNATVPVIDLVSQYDTAPSPLNFNQIFARDEPPQPKLNDKIQEHFNIKDAVFLAQGGEGKVYLAHQHRTGKVHVVKYIKHHSYYDTRRFPNEIERLTSIGLGHSSSRTHDNILKILQWYPPVGTSPDCAYVMEFCPLDDLERFTWAHFHGSPNEHARPHEALLRSLYIDLLQGLEFMHSATTPTGMEKPSIIHGDIKPQNILLTANHALPGHWAYAVPTAKLADFGGATAKPVFKNPLPYPDFKAQNWQYRKLRQLYTQNWAAPEALPSDGHFGADDLYARLMPSTDVYSVAASINFMVTASPAKKGGGFKDMSLSTDYFKKREYWHKGRDKGNAWWERNVSLVANNDILPRNARMPEGTSTTERRRAWPSARAKGMTTEFSLQPKKEYSLLFMMALKRGFEPDVEKRADVQTLLGWLRGGFDQYIRELIYDEGTVGIDG
ncbi:kinase-like domain-containing protein [Phyllosticta citrichinensis]|uniref:Kinase-like domain-containing protein n=1 Tax=Phyllosticta citrichinensis TaxID=1130410 RepID=A0ABR1XSM9_9PEZI